MNGSKQHVKPGPIVLIVLVLLVIADIATQFFGRIMNHFFPCASLVKASDSAPCYITTYDFYFVAVLIAVLVVTALVALVRGATKGKPEK